MRLYIYLLINWKVFIKFYYHKLYKFISVCTYIQIYFCIYLYNCLFIDLCIYLWILNLKYSNT